MFVDRRALLSPRSLWSLRNIVGRQERAGQAPHLQERSAVSPSTEELFPLPDVRGGPGRGLGDTYALPIIRVPSPDDWKLTAQAFPALARPVWARRNAVIHRLAKPWSPSPSL
jgi:hypothetical protein